MVGLRAYRFPAECATDGRSPRDARNVTTEQTQIPQSHTLGARITGIHKHPETKDENIASVPSLHTHFCELRVEWRIMQCF